MNKSEFLNLIYDRLTGLPAADLQKTIAYYSEMIDDRMEDGMSETQAVSAMGDIDEIISQALMDTSLPKLVKAKVKPARKLRAWEIVLLILGSPIWVPLLLAATVVFFAIYIVLWAIIVCFYAADLSFAVGALAGIVCALIMGLTGQPVQAIFFLAAGLICAGLSILLFFGCNQMAKAAVKLTAKIGRWLKSKFIGKEKVK